MSNKLKKQKDCQSLKWTTIAREFTGYLLDLCICIYMLLVIGVMPIYYREGFLHIGSDKATFFRHISVSTGWFILPVLILSLIFGIREHRKIQIKLSMTDRFALLYGASLLLSYLCSSYRKETLWGAGGWFMGLLPQLFLLASYFLISRFWEVRKWMLLLFLPVSAVVFTLGLLNRFGIFPLDMKLVNVQFISTIGNINWYCGYLVSVFFGGCYLLWQMPGFEKKQRWKWLLLMAYVAIGFATLITHGSMSGLVTLVVMLMVFFCLSVKSCRRMMLFWQQVLLLSVVCLFTMIGRRFLGWQITYTDSVVDLLTESLLPVAMCLVAAIFVGLLWHWEKKKAYPVRLFQTGAKLLVAGSAVAAVAVIIMLVANTLHPGILGPLSQVSLFTFSPTWGSNRATTWKAGLMCFGEQNLLHKLIGVGPDGMSAYLYSDGSSALRQMVAEVFGTNSLTNAHNEWITMLVNMGLVGCAGFVGMMVSGIYHYIKSGLVCTNVSEGKDFHKLILGACGCCLLAYTINNMFSFQQCMSGATIFVILGVGEAISRKNR